MKLSNTIALNADKCIWLLASVFLVAMVDLLILPWYFPPTEGWWETYAWLMNESSNLYSEIKVPFPPLQIIWTRFQLDLLGVNFISLRLIGVVTHGLAVTFTYLWLEKLTTPRAAFVGALLPSLYVIYPNGAYIVRDYHTSVELFVAAALFASTYIIRFPATEFTKCNGPNWKALLLAGMSCGFLVLLKQNIGVFFTFGLVLCVILFRYESADQHRLKSCGLAAFIFVIGLALPLVALSCYFGVDWFSVYIGNQSKGSLGHVLFRFLTDPTSRKILFIAALFLALLPGWSLVLKIYSKVGSGMPQSSILGNLTPFVRIVFVVAIAKGINLSLSNVIFSAAIAWVGHQPFRERKDAGWLRYGFIPLSMLVYSGTLTAGYNSVSMQMVLAGMISCGVVALESRVKIGRMQVLGAGFAVSLLVLALKLAGPLYDWWGLRQSGLMAAKHSLAFNELSGFRVDQRTSQLFEIANSKKEKLADEDTILSYPSMPILYMLLQKKPVVNVPVMWFDVSSYSKSEDVVATLQKNPPKIVFWLRPPDFVYEGHSKLRGQPSLMDVVDKWLYAEIRAGRYILSDKLVQFYVNDSPDSKNQYLYNPSEVEVLVTKAGLSYGEIEGWDGIVKVDSPSNTKCRPNDVISVGSRLKIVFKNNTAQDELLSKIGVPYVIDNAHTFITLERVNEADGIR